MSIGSTKRREEDEDSELPPPPDGGWGWMVVFGSFMIHVISKYLLLFINRLFYIFTYSISILLQ